MPYIFPFSWEYIFLSLYAFELFLGKLDFILALLLIPWQMDSWRWFLRLWKKYVKILYPTIHGEPWWAIQTLEKYGEVLCATVRVKLDEPPTWIEFASNNNFPFGGGMISFLKLWVEKRCRTPPAMELNQRKRIFVIRYFTYPHLFF